MPNMAIRVVEFSNGGYKIRKIFAPFWNLHNPYYYKCLSKSWTQLFLKRPNHTWSETEVGRQFRCWTCVQTNKQANLEEEKYQMKSHPALNIELKKKKKTRQIEMTGSRKLKWPEVENWNGRKSKKKMSETTNWLRLRSHSYLRSKVVGNFVPFCSYTMKIHTDTDSTS